MRRNDRKLVRWELREEKLKKKKADIELPFTRDSDHHDDEEEYFRELALSENQL